MSIFSNRKIYIPCVVEVLNFAIFLVSTSRFSRLMKFTTKCLNE